MICPGLVADDLSGFWKVSKPGDRDATRGTDGEVYRRAGALSGGEIELRGGGRAARGQRATLPASSRPLSPKPNPSTPNTRPIRTGAVAVSLTCCAAPIAP